ncbi:MAG: fatty acid desaturase [Ilumatobacteraceae bacterium]
MSDVDLRLRRALMVEHATVPAGARSAGHVAIAWGVYVGLAIVVHRADHPAVSVFGWFLMGWLLLGNGAMTHETLHGHLFRRAWCNTLVGVIAAWSIGAPFEVYRAYHLGHHRHSVTADDPEGPPYVFTSRWVYLAVPFGGALFAVQLFWWGLRAAAGRPPVFIGERHRAAAARDTLLGLAVFAVVVWLAVRDLGLVVDVWLAPWLFAVAVLEPFVLVPEHYGAREQDAASPSSTTRTILSNRLVTWVYWANNFHTTHHLAAGLTPQRIPALTRDLVLPSLSPQWVDSGYLKFHWRLFTHPARYAPRASPVHSGDALDG